MGDIPNAVVKRLLSKHGEDMRVSGGAIDRAVAAAEGYLARLAKEAHACAVADKRKTIMDGDVEKAVQRIG
jgi:histone H3/H4